MSPSMRWNCRSRFRRTPLAGNPGPRSMPLLRGRDSLDEHVERQGARLALLLDLDCVDDALNETAELPLELGDACHTTGIQGLQRSLLRVGERGLHLTDGERASRARRVDVCGRPTICRALAHEDPFRRAACPARPPPTASRRFPARPVARGVHPAPRPATTRCGTPSSASALVSAGARRESARGIPSRAAQGRRACG